MDNVFRGAGGLKQQRTFKGKKATTSSSMGVRLGYVADIERAPPDGAPSKRKARRIPTSVKIHVGDTWKRVAGDVSAGGALLLLDFRVEEPELELTIELKEGRGAWHIVAEVLRREVRGRRIAHHLRFPDPAQAEGLNEVIEEALNAGETRLDTV